MLPIQQQILSQTNIIRQAHSLPPLSWNYQLANEVQKYANTCPGFKHGGPKGHQNLAKFYPCTGYEQCKNKVGPAWMWYNKEETLWNYSMNTCSTGRWWDCGHFTNSMSPGATQMGCGLSFSEFCGGGEYVWCNYVGAENNPKIPNRSLSKEALKHNLLLAN